jgi:predicted XRE-type DNA-binding protein
VKTKKKHTVTKNASELADALGLTPSDAIEWEIRSELVSKIIEAVEKNSITITQLAKDSGTSRARVTKILKEASIGISLDVLFRVLRATGYKVKLRFSKAA